MAASYPGTVVTEPTAQIATNQTIRASHMDQLYLEVIALEQSLLGTLGANRTLKPATSAGVPLTIQGVTSQSGDYVNIGSSVDATDKLILNSAGRLKLTVQGSSGGLAVGSLLNPVIFYSPGNNQLRVVPSTAETVNTFAVRNSADSSSAFTVDTQNTRVAVGDGSPTASIHIKPGTTTTSAANGIQFGTESSGNQTNLYRAGVRQLQTDASLTVSTGILQLGASTILTTAAGGGIPSTALLTLWGKDFEVRRTDGVTRVVLSAPGGTRYAIRFTDDGELITEAA